MDELARRIVFEPDQVRAELLTALERETPDYCAATRGQLVDLDTYVKKRYGKHALLETRRLARLAEWKMAERWPRKGGGRDGRDDDRPRIGDTDVTNKRAWALLYAVGRAPIERILAETDPMQLTQQAVRRWTSPDPVPDTIRQGDARTVLTDIPDDSVDLILTDPPYGDQSRDLYTWLGQFAMRVLKPGGSAVVLTGHSRLPDDIRRLESAGLTYWWVLAEMHRFGQTRFPGRWVTVGWKPALWMVKGSYKQRVMVHDVLNTGHRPDKDKHPWAQSESFTYVIDVLCPEGGLIVDPFAGTGRWGELAEQMGRRWIGADTGGAVIVQ